MLNWGFTLINDAKETIDSRSEFGDDAKSAFSMLSAWDSNTLGDLSPDAL